MIYLAKTRSEIVYLAGLRTEFEKMKTYLNDDKPVFLTFLDITNYNDSKDERKVMIKIRIEKAED